MNKKFYYLLLCTLFLPFCSFSQVGINTTTPYAQVDIKASNPAAPSQSDGLLIPRINNFPATNPNYLQNGMLVFLTTTQGSKLPGFYYWNHGATQWSGVSNAAGWGLTGNAGIDPAVNFLGTTDDNDLVLKRNDVVSGRIGTTNLSLGILSLSNNSGLINTAIGHYSLSSLTTGSYNVGLGSNTLNKNTTGGFNVAIGGFALSRNITGARNIALGSSSLLNVIGANDNIAIGYLSLAANTASSNIAIGSESLTRNTTGQQNVAMGYSALGDNKTGNFNLGVGTEALRKNTAGNYNAALGFMALHSNTTGLENTAVGANALFSNTTGEYNNAMGSGVLYNNTTGKWNVGIGHNALKANTGGSNNVGVGYQTLMENTGSSQVAIGSQALKSNTSGFFNVGVGTQSLTNNSTGIFNVGLGVFSLRANTTGSSNTALGYLALNTNTVGSNNIALGYNALNSNTTGTNNTALGYNAFSTGSAYNNSTAIGNGSAITASNQVRVGNAAVTSIGGQVAWTALSDKRFKRNIVEDVPGLKFIKKLRPVTYNLDAQAISLFLKVPDSLRSKTAEAIKTSRTQSGLLAQEVEKAAQEIGYDFSGVDAPESDDDYYGLRYAEFVVPLIKAVQEQQVIIERQNLQYNDLKKELELLKDKVEKGLDNR